MNTLPPLRFMTCGSVDDGKSTLLGRLLWETNNIFLDQTINLSNKNISSNDGKPEFDYSLLLDGLSSEQEQNITIDIAYKQFQTKNRRFYLADSPGHEEYTCQMATASYHSDLALLLVSANNGIKTQTLRHAHICSLFGIKNILLIINKMDLVNYSQKIFEEIQSEFIAKTNFLNFNKIKVIPVSALQGENILYQSEKTPWYLDKPLFTQLENWNIKINKNKFGIFPVQLVLKGESNSRYYAGTLLSGELDVHEPLYLARSSSKITLKEIIKNKMNALTLHAGESAVLNFSQEIDCVRGDLLTSNLEVIQNSNSFQAMLIWLNKKSGQLNNKLIIQHNHKYMTAQITNINYKFNPLTFEKVLSTEIHMNDISSVNIDSHNLLNFCLYETQKELGSFLLIDPYTFETLAIGIIKENLKNQNQLSTNKFSINKTDREILNGHKGHVLWMTGLSGSGKSTLANSLSQSLHLLKIRTYILDGDHIRQGLNKDLGFSDADRSENLRRIAEVAKLFLDAGVFTIVAFISPFKKDREIAKNIIGKQNITEIYLSSQLNECEKRDSKNLYKKAREGIIPNFSGISSPYEIPEYTDIEVNIDKLNTTESLDKVIQYLVKNEIIK